MEPSQDIPGEDMSVAVEPWPGFPQCPCGCGVSGLKLQVRNDGHLVGCECPVCRGRRNRRKGQAAQRKSHQRLGGVGWTPTNEEWGRPYIVEVAILPEVKTGQQIPASFDRFVSSEWFRRALAQSQRSAPAGSGVLPAVVVRGDWCLVDIRKREFREQAERSETG